jgi:hypothetical protein
MSEEPAPYANVFDAPPPPKWRLKFMQQPDLVRPGVTRTVVQLDTHFRPNWWIRFWQRTLLDITWEKIPYDGR